MALDIYASDQEKGEAIQRWWRENLLAVVTGIVIGLLLLFGVRSWMGQRQQQVKEASTLYQQVLAVKAQQRDAEISGTAKRLVQEHGNTPYGVFGALILAKEEQKQDDPEAAIEHFEWILEHTKNRGLQRIAYLRLAQLQLAGGKAEEALASLDKIEPGSFSSAYEEVRGDAHVLRGQLAAARRAYQEALQGVENEQRQRILRMKLENIAQS